MDSLPNEIFVYLTAFLTPEDQAIARLVSKEWYYTLPEKRFSCEEIAIYCIQNDYTTLFFRIWPVNRTPTLDMHFVSIRHNRMDINNWMRQHTQTTLDKKFCMKCAIKYNKLIFLKEYLNNISRSHILGYKLLYDSLAFFSEECAVWIIREFHHEYVHNLAGAVNFGTKKV